MKASIKTLLILTAVTGCTATALASIPNPNAGMENQEQSQSKILADIDGILHATAAKASNLTNQVDQFLASIENSNTVITRLNDKAQLNSKDFNLPANSMAAPAAGSVNLNPISLNNYINFQANQATYKNVTTSLSAAQGIINPSSFVDHNTYLEALFQGATPTADTKSKTKPTPQEIITNQLTVGTPASDSLWLTDPQTGPSSDTDYLQPSQKAFISQQPNNLDSYMAAPTFFSPYNGSYFTTPTGNKAYSANAAKAYLAYLTDAFKPLGTNIHWSAVAPKAVTDNTKNRPKGSNHQAAVRAHNIYKIKNSSTYQNYQLTKRSILAAQSAVQSMFNYLYYERMPSQQLAQQSHLPPAYTSTTLGSNGKPVTTVSPLQLEDYTANHRANSSAWYQSMSTASPATVQRETLFVLADILKMMQQAHMDRERLLFMAALQANETTNGMKQTASQQVNAVNTMIEKLPGVAKQKKKDQGAAELGVNTGAASGASADSSN